MAMIAMTTRSSMSVNAFFMLFSQTAAGGFAAD
jgi:hypothetical protein